MVQTFSGVFVIACSVVPLVLAVLSLRRLRGTDPHPTTARFQRQFAFAMALMFAGLLVEGVAILAGAHTVGTIAGLVFVVGIGLQFLAQRRFERPRS